MLIAPDSLYLLILFITPLAAKLSVETGVAVCGCPIYINFFRKYSLIWKFVKFAPISASIADASTFFMILHLACNALFFSSINLWY